MHNANTINYDNDNDDDDDDDNNRHKWVIMQPGSSEANQTMGSYC